MKDGAEADSKRELASVMRVAFRSVGELGYLVRTCVSDESGIQVSGGAGLFGEMVLWSASYSQYSKMDSK